MSTPQQNNSAIKDLLKEKTLINGAWVESHTGKKFAVFNPFDQSKLADVPDMDAQDTTTAIDAAYAAFSLWKKKTAAERAKFLYRWHELILENAAAIGRLMTLEQGKPFSEAKGEVEASAETVKWYAEEARRVYGDVIEGQKPGTRIVITRHPVGVVGAITPWNFPSSMITRKIAPALAAGCTVVLKPAEDTPLTALALAALAQEAGLPPGVLNVITSSSAKEIGETLTTDDRVRKISFTGSTEVGKILMKQASRNLQKISLELGGNAPFIIFPDADLDLAVDGAIASKFRNAGQTCICANRIFVHADIFDAFAKLFVQKTEGLKVGNGLEEGVKIGPLINQDGLEKVEKLMADARSKGTKVLTGGKKHGFGGTFYEPTVLTQVDRTMDLFKEEIFGPVAPLYKFTSEDEAIAAANDTEYGLAAYLYAQNQGLIWRVSEALDYGMVAVNEPLLATDLAPFGGVKHSGMGREGGKYGLPEYTELKYRLLG